MGSMRTGRRGIATGRGARALVRVVVGALALSLASVLPATTAEAALLYPVTANIQLGSNAFPMGTAADPAHHRVFVADYGNDDVQVVDTLTNTVTATISSNGPRDVAYDAVNDIVYVAEYDGDSIKKYDGSTFAFIAGYRAGRQPVSIDVDPVLGKVYVGVWGSNVGVSVVDASFPSSVGPTMLSLPDAPRGLRVDPSDHSVYVSTSVGLTVIDGTTNAVDASIALPAGPNDVDIDLATHRVYVPSVNAGVVSTIDGPTRSLVGSTTVSGQPWAVGVDSETHTVYAASDYAVTVIDPTSLAVRTIVSGTGEGPRGAAVDSTVHQLFVASALSTRLDVVTEQDQPPAVVVARAPGQASSTQASSISFTATFNDDVTGFTAADVSFAGSTATGALTAAVAGGPSSYTITVTGMTGNGSVVVSIPAGAAVDTQGRANSASTGSATVVYDFQSPTVILERAPGQAASASTSPVSLTITFSEPVQRITGSDISFSGSTVGGTLQAVVQPVPNDQVYFVDVTGMTTPGDLVMSVPAGATTNLVGNPSQASTSSLVITWDSTAPTATITQSASTLDPTSQVVSFDVVFSTPITGFDNNDITFTGSTASGTLRALTTATGSDGMHYRVVVVGQTSAGTIVVHLPAGAVTSLSGAPNRAAVELDNQVTFSPETIVTVEQAAGQADPAQGDTVSFTVSLSAVPTGLDASDFSFAGSTVGGTLVPILTGSGTEYTLTVSGMTTAGIVTAALPANTTTNSRGFGNLASTSVDNSVAWSASSVPTDPPAGGGGSGGSPDVLAPGVTVAQAVGQLDPAEGGSVSFSVEFSEPVTGFDGSDVSFAGSTVGGALAASVAGGPSAYVVSVAGMTSSGTIVVSLPSGAAADAAGNPSSASTSVDNSVQWGAPAPTDPPTGGGSGSGTGTGTGTGPGIGGTEDVVAPTVTVDQEAGQADPASSSPVSFAVTFTEPVTGLTAFDVSFAGSTVGGTLVPALTGSGTQYTLTVSGMTTAGVVTASLPAGAATDAAGNPSSASTSVDDSVQWDAAPPTIRCIARPVRVVARSGHRLVAVRVAVRVSDPGTGVEGVVLRSVTSNQADSGLGRGDLPGDTIGWDAESFDVSGYVRAERFRGDRVYSLTYEVVDRAGNTAPCTTTVTVTRG